MAESKTRTERIPLLLTTDELQQLDDWQFEHRARTRSDAIRELMRLGYEASRKPPQRGQTG